MNHRPPMVDMIRRTWSPEKRASSFGEASIAEKGGLTLLIIATELSVRGICARMGRHRVIATEIYQLLVVAVLITLSVRSHLSAALAMAVLAYLVYEILAWSIFDIFVESRFIELHGRRSPFRAFLWGVYSYVVVAWAYGVYYWASNDIVDSEKHELPSVVAGIYYSIVTITTVGYGDYTPRKDARVSQLVVASEPLVGFVILLLYFAVLVSAVSESFKRSIEG